MPSIIYFTPTTEEKRSLIHFFEQDDLLQEDIDDIIYDSFAKYSKKSKQIENYDEAEELIL